MRSDRGRDGLPRDKRHDICKSLEEGSGAPGKPSSLSSGWDSGTEGWRADAEPTPDQSDPRAPQEQPPAPSPANLITRRQVAALLPDGRRCLTLLAQKGPSDPLHDWSPEKRERLLRLIDQRTLHIDPEGFTLSSGRSSTFLFNLKNLYGHPEAAHLATEALLHRLQGLECDYIAGLELGAVFPVAAAVAQSHGHGDVHGFVIRKEAKGHGSRNRIEGLTETDPQEGRVVIVEDVTTTGGSLLQAVEVAKSLGFTVEQAITIVDREEGAVEKLKERGIELIALYAASDFERIP